jgi:putative tricarboxylic transport membrane protein
MNIALGRVLAGIVLAVWSIVFFVLALGFDKPLNPFDSGPRVFPLLIAACLFFLAVGMIVVEFRRLHLPESIKVKRLGPIALAAGLMILYALAIPYAGYYLATLVFLPAMMMSAGEFRGKWLILITAMIILFNYLSFDLLLGVTLPKIGAAFVE